LLREKRKWVQAHRRIGDPELAHWFANSPRSILAHLPLPEGYGAISVKRRSK